MYLKMSNISIEANIADLDQTALVWVHTVCLRCFFYRVK